ncbi:MAG: DUF58 domain-containing protein [Thermomicrobiales bacterium]
MLPLRPTSRGEGRGRSVFFNRLWIGGAALVLLIGMAAGEAALALLALLVLITAGLAWAWNRYALAGVVYTRDLSATRVFPGDEVTLSIGVRNWKPLPLPGLAIDDEIAEALLPLNRKTTIGAGPGRRILHFTTSVRPFERVSWRVPLRCERRGLHALGPAVLRSGDPFGFFTSRLTVADEATVLVYPRVHAIADLGFPTRQPFGETRVSRHLLTDPARVVGARDYRPDDPFRSIHWKATARQMRLQVRVHEPTTTLQLGVFVNLDTFEHYWEGLDVDLSERAIEVGASIAAWAVGQRYATGVYANGIVAGSDQALRIPPGRGPSQLPHILEGLAKLTPYSTLNFPRLFKIEAGRFPWGSTTIVVTGMMPEALTAQLAAMLAGGLRVVLIPLGDCPVPSLRGLVVRRIDTPMELAS